MCLPAARRVYACDAVATKLSMPHAPLALQDHLHHRRLRMTCLMIFITGLFVPTWAHASLSPQLAWCPHLMKCPCSFCEAISASSAVHDCSTSRKAAEPKWCVKSRQPKLRRVLYNDVHQLECDKVEQTAPVLCRCSPAKNLWLSFPMQLPTSRQWWSKRLCIANRGGSEPQVAAANGRCRVPQSDLY